jgi:hypothetical protein
MCQTTKFSVRKTIQRLEEKKIITRNTFKNGRGGWTQYELADVVFKEIMQEETQEKLRTNLGQSEDKLRTQLRTELRKNLSSSSSNNINTTTTGGDNFSVEERSYSQELPLEWQTVNIEPLNQIGFTMTHLTQLAKTNKLPPAIVQDSIYAFSFDLEHNEKAKTIKGSPINLFMGILRNGQPYAAPSNYESPVALSMRLYLEKKRGDELRIQAMEKELLDMDFKEWSNTLSPDEKESLLPDDIRRQKLEGPKVAYLRTYHRESIWPNKRKEIP